MSGRPAMQQLPVLAQLLYASPEPPRVDLDRVLAHLRERFGRVAVPDGAGDNATMIELQDLPAGDLEGTRVPTTLTLLPSAEPPPSDEMNACAEQSWDWPEAKDGAARAESSIIAMPMLSWVWLDRASRLAIVHAAVDALLEESTPIALHWPMCRRLVAPDAYRRGRAESADPLYPASNVRLFRITDGEPGEVLMDTLGLAPFGLPDFQIRSAGPTPSQIAAQLFSLALYEFQNGDVIDDGHTVEGVPAGTAWRCRRGPSAVEPDRVVIELQQ
jgi:hypothetical protein